MSMETEIPGQEARRPGRVEVWLFVAVLLVGLLGFMATLSTGDVEGVVGSEESKSAIYAPQNPEAVK